MSESVPAKMMTREEFYAAARKVFKDACVQCPENLDQYYKGYRGIYGLLDGGSLFIESRRNGQPALMYG